MHIFYGNCVETNDSAIGLDPRTTFHELCLRDRRSANVC